ncbi:hypothetical protein M431DRAFT_489140 [Trichoderma harzianum CBS 226.95]|uniref:Uncharacterized protein n=1 Tax=Trichoderma harzianum CBS 226.95 TaxID=983964 RepID=A0A2T4ATJ0_TRIHA|nr:hypothetical protein M431DRAFT_489140 [Trichoderma harzianum CBS 226.95]PTB60376.1 hypothetical protein M431DRAFT_489140 [Trichoderma harzianum CBS 226.95]
MALAFGNPRPCSRTGERANARNIACCEYREYRRVGERAHRYMYAYCAGLNERVQYACSIRTSSCLVFLALSLPVSLACLLGTGPQWLKPARPSTLLTGWLAAR